MRAKTPDVGETNYGNQGGCYSGFPNGKRSALHSAEIGRVTKNNSKILRRITKWKKSTALNPSSADAGYRGGTVAGAEQEKGLRHQSSLEKSLPEVDGMGNR